MLSVEEELNNTKALRPRGMKTVAKAVADAKMKVQSLFTLNLNHTRAVPSLRGFLLWNTKEDFCLSGPLLSSSCTQRRFTKDQFSQKEHKTKIVEFCSVVVITFAYTQRSLIETEQKQRFAFVQCINSFRRSRRILAVVARQVSVV